MINSVVESRARRWPTPITPGFTLWLGDVAGSLLGDAVLSFALGWLFARRQPQKASGSSPVNESDLAALVRSYLDDDEVALLPDEPDRETRLNTWCYTIPEGSIEVANVVAHGSRGLRVRQPRVGEQSSGDEVTSSNEGEATVDPFNEHLIGRVEAGEGNAR